MLTYIIEDDPLKAENIRVFLAELDSSGTLKTFRSYNSGLCAVREKVPDLIVLDMTLPTYDRSPAHRAGRLRPLGGYELLRKVRLYNIKVASIVVTMLETFGEGDEEISYDDMTKRCILEFSSSFLGSVHFQLTTSGWQKELGNIYKSFKDELK